MSCALLQRNTKFRRFLQGKFWTPAFRLKKGPMIPRMSVCQ